MLTLELGLEEVLAILQLLDLRHVLLDLLLVPLRLVGQLLVQALALLHHLAALQLLGAELALNLTQALLQCSSCLCEDKKEYISKKKVVSGRSGSTSQQSPRISGATPSLCAGAPP